MALFGFAIVAWLVMGIGCALFGGLFTFRIPTYSGKHTSRKAH